MNEYRINIRKLIETGDCKPPEENSQSRKELVILRDNNNTMIINDNYLVVQMYSNVEQQNWRVWLDSTGSEVKNQPRMNENGHLMRTLPNKHEDDTKTGRGVLNSKKGGYQRKHEEKILYGYKKTQTCYATQQPSGVRM